MLQSVLNFIKDKVLLVAFVILGAFTLYQCNHTTAPLRVETVKYVPTIVYKDSQGKEEAKVTETVVTKPEMKDMTKKDDKALHATQINSETNIVDHSSITLKDDTISIKRYDTRKWFLGPTIQQVNITHTDTSIHSTEANSLTFKEPRVLFVVGPYVGYDVINQKPSIGVSVTFNLFQIKAKR